MTFKICLGNSEIFFLKTYFGQKVILDMRSCTASVNPLITKTLPTPFHRQVIPCHRWIFTTIGINVTGTM